MARHHDGVARLEEYSFERLLVDGREERRDVIVPTGPRRPRLVAAALHLTC
jgi:hypothetical protein